MKFNGTLTHLVSMKYFIHHQPMALFYDIPWVGTEFYEIPWVVTKFYDIPWVGTEFYDTPWVVTEFYDIPWVGTEFLRVGSKLKYDKSKKRVDDQKRREWGVKIKHTPLRGFWIKAPLKRLILAQILQEGDKHVHSGIKYDSY